MSLFVDWDWANRLYSLAIFEAAGLSLGFELNTLAPVRQRFTDRPYIEPPKEYSERVFLAYEAVRTGKLMHTGLTAEKSRTFDPSANFDTGQSWEVNPADFRRWCEAEALPVPVEWLPRGYAPAQNPTTSVADSASTTPGRRLARLRELRGDAIHKRGEWKITGISALVASEKNEGRKRSDEKTIRADLKEAAENERGAKRANAFSGLGQR